MQKRTSRGSRGGTFKKSLLGWVGRSNSEHLSTGGKHGPAKGWHWENIVETGAVQALVLQTTQELIRKHDFYAFCYIKQACEVLTYCRN